MRVDVPADFHVVLDRLEPLVAPRAGLRQPAEIVAQEAPELATRALDEVRLAGLQHAQQEQRARARALVR